MSKARRTNSYQFLNIFLQLTQNISNYLLIFIAKHYIKHLKHRICNNKNSPLSQCVNITIYVFIILQKQNMQR